MKTVMKMFDLTGRAMGLFRGPLLGFGLSMIAIGPLSYLLRRSNRIRQVVEAEDATRAMDVLRERGADIVFLDIQMPGLSGLQMTQLMAGLPEPPAVIFVTAYQEHAVEAFQLAAFDYLLKPVRADRLNLTLERLALSARNRRDQSSRSENPAQGGDRLAVTHRVHRIGIQQPHRGILMIGEREIGRPEEDHRSFG